MKCILLCAGYATRLFPLTENFPKALLEIEENKPLLNYIVKNVNQIEEIDQIYLISNQRYYEHFANWAEGLNNIKPIKVLNDNTTNNDDRLGAIGDIEYVIKNENIDDDIIVIAGDNLFDYSLRGLIDFYKDKKDSVVCVKSLKNDDLSRFAIATLDEEQRIIDLEEKPENPKTDIAVYATYIYPKDIVPKISEYLEAGYNKDAPGYFVEYLYKIEPVYAYHFDGNCYDVGTHESLKMVRESYNKK